MRKTIFDKLNIHYREIIDKVLTKQFGDFGFKTEWNLFSMSLVSTWNKKLSLKKKKEIKKYVAVYSDGYAEAMNFVGNLGREKK